MPQPGDSDLPTLDHGPVDVTVRIPVGFANPAEAAGFIERAVASEMERAGFIGSPVVIFRNEQGNFLMFEDGQGFSSQGFLAPHFMGS